MEPDLPQLKAEIDELRSLLGNPMVLAQQQVRALALLGFRSDASDEDAVADLVASGYRIRRRLVILGASVGLILFLVGGAAGGLAEVLVETVT